MNKFLVVFTSVDRIFQIYIDVRPDRKNQSDTYEAKSPLAREQWVYRSANVVLAAAFMLESYQIAIFCNSLRFHSPETTIVLFIDSKTSFKKEGLLDSDSIDIIYVDRSANSMPMRFRSFDMTNLRWVLYRRYLLEEERHSYFKYIWMIDVDDIYFQSDPFRLFAELPSDKDALVVFQQGGFRTIGECPLSSNAIRDCFGSHVLSNVESQKIINVAAIAATTAAALQVLEIYVDVYNGERLGTINNFFPACERKHSDQGLLNVLVYLKFAPNLDIFVYKEEERPFFADLQSSKFTRIKYSKVFNNNNFLIPVVHGYDSNYDLLLAQIQQYAPFVNVNSPIDGWNETEACSNYTLVESIDVLSSICDVKLERSLSTTRCCEFCNIASSECQAFTFTRGLCYLKRCENQKQYVSRISMFEGGSVNFEPSKGVFFAYQALERPRRRHSSHLRGEFNLN